jgi:hypothetical protein
MPVLHGAFCLPTALGAQTSHNLCGVPSFLSLSHPVYSHNLLHHKSRPRATGFRMTPCPGFSHPARNIPFKDKDQHPPTRAPGMHASLKDLTS